MKILDKLTIRNLRLNKKRTIVTIIGVILSVALICAVGGMFSCLQATLLQNAIDDNGYYHVSLKTDSKNVRKLTKNRDIKNVMNIYEMGYSELSESQNEYKPYVRLLSLENPENFLNLSFILKEGRYPANQKEVVISESILTNGKVDYKVGDTISLNLGKRYACGTLVTEDRYLPNELKYGDSDEIVCESENIKVEETVSVKIVGIIERPNYAIEAYSQAGYSIFSTGYTSDEVMSYIVFKNPKDYKNSTEELSNFDGYQGIRLNNEVLRFEVFKFSDSTMSMLIAILSVVMLIIMVTSIFCIRNSFAISTLEKTRMFGMLSSVGATKRQIKKSVLKEAMFIGLIGIPLGILSGIFADFILIIVMNKLVGSYLLGSEFIFKISLISIFFSGILGILTIYFSAKGSARKASKISPMEAIRNTNDIKLNQKSLKTPWIISKIFKTGGVISYKNLKRSKKKYRTTVISLVVSIFTFITMNSFINYAFSLTDVYYTDYDYNIQIYSSEFNSDAIQTILSLPGIENYSLLYDTSEPLVIRDLSHVTDFGYETFIKGMGDCTKTKCHDRSTIDLNIIILAKETFKYYVESNGLDYESVKNKAILNDYYFWQDSNGKMTNKRIYNYKENSIIQGTYQDLKKEFQIKVLKEKPMGLENTYIDGGYLFLNQEYYQDFEVIPYRYLAIQAKDSDKLEESLNKLKLDIKVNNIDSQVKQEKSMILLYSIFLYGFITVITLIGVTNIFNTITANMTLRQKEFAVLKSIGMTKKEFNRMINLETFFYSFKALFYGILLGTFGSFLMYKAFATGYDSGFQIPYKAIFISIIFVVLLVFIIMKYSINKINKQNIIETIRKENV